MRPQLLDRAVAEAHRQGVQRDDSDEFFDAIDAAVSTLVQGNRKQARQDGTAQEPAPEFFEPKPPPALPPRELNSSNYSAPVRRELRGSGTPLSPSQVRLSPEEREAARVAGITESEYAKQKMKMLQSQQSGLTQR